MKILIPTKYDVDYPEENRAYYYGIYKKNMQERLLKASKGYCMYCGVLLHVEEMNISQIEHSVDKGGNQNQKKSNDKSPLTNCKYNLAIACQDCNMKYKKIVEKSNLKNKFKFKCPSICNSLCDDYISVRKEYIEKNKIILQPIGISDEEQNFKVEYDIFKHLYIPCIVGKNNISFIQHHIMRFHLNREKFSENIIDLCADVIELKEMGVDTSEKILSFLSCKEQINIIGKEFLEELNKRFISRSIDDLIGFCRLIVLCNAWI